MELCLEASFLILFPGYGSITDVIRGKAAGWDWGRLRNGDWGWEREGGRPLSGSAEID